MRCLLSLLILVIASGAAAQTTISGTVKSNRGQALSGVSISIKDAYDGATSDAAGAFRFVTSDTGKLVLTATSIGYKTYETTINANGTPMVLAIALKEDVTELQAVTITAGSFEASDRKKVTVLSSIDLVTTASANGDVTGALKTLPGAQQVGESEGLFVRGGTAAETKTFIDGTLVNNFFFSSVPNVATRGRFSPFIFKGTVFSTGGYSALYGQALSAALILESIDLPEQSSANFGLSVLSANAGFQKLNKKKNASWGLNYSYTDLALAFSLVKQQQDFFQRPLFHNVDANFRLKTSKTGMLKYYGYFNFNKLGFTVNSLDSIGYNDLFKLRNHNHYHNLSWKEALGKGWKLQTGFSVTYNRDNIRGGFENGSTGKEETVGGREWKTFGLTSRGRFLNGKAVIEKRLAGINTFRGGVEANNSRETTEFTLYNGQQFPGVITENTSAVFAETDFYLTNAIAVKTGLRAERSAALDKLNLAPRLSLAYKLGKNAQASFAYGQFYQTPETRFLDKASVLGFSKATHYILQYQKVYNDRTLRLEAFHKDYDNLVKTNSVVAGQSAATGTTGHGYARGFEAFWRDKKSVKFLDYWVSYSYLDTKRDFLNYPFSIQPNFAARHTASFVAKRFVLPWKTGFNASYTYSASRPFFFIAPDANGNNSFVDRGETPDFHNVSFSLNYLPYLGQKSAKQNTVFVLSINNIFGLDQEFGRRYSFDGRRFETIVPPSKRFIFIGVFVSLGVDRTQEIINNNL